MAIPAKWPYRSKSPTKPPGQELRTVHVDLSLAFSLALAEFVRQQSQQHDRAIGKGLVLETLALRVSPELRKLYRQYAELFEHPSRSPASSAPKSEPASKPSTPSAP